MMSQFRKTRSAIVSTCQYWRDTGIAMPSLWRTFVAQSYRIEGPLSRAPYIKLALPDPTSLLVELERSAPFPPDLYIRLDESGAVTHWASISSYMTEALSHDRICSLDLLVASLPSHLVPFCHPQRVASLQHLVLEWSGDCEESYVVDLTGAVGLQSLSLTYSSTDQTWRRHYVEPKLLRVRLPDVETCAIQMLKLQGDIDLSDIMQGMMCCATALQSVKLIASSSANLPDEELRARYDACPFPRLNSMRLDGDYPLIFVENIKAPHLQQLSCTWRRSPRTVPEAFSSMLGKHSGIRHFSINLPQEHMPMAFIRSLTSLETLRTASMESFTAVLASSVESMPSLPNLKSAWTPMHNPHTPYEIEWLRGLLEQLRQFVGIRSSNHDSLVPIVVHIVYEDLLWRPYSVRGIEEWFKDGSVIFVLHEKWEEDPMNFAYVSSFDP